MNKAVQFVGLGMSGLLAGNELATLIGLHPALRALPPSARIEAERTLTTRLGKIMPFYMSATVASVIAAAVDRRGTPGVRLTGSAAAASLLMLAITLTGNVPLNARTVAYPADGDPAGYAAVRRRWERLHTARVLLDVGAFAALTTAALADDQRRVPRRGDRLQRRRWWDEASSPEDGFAATTPSGSAATRAARRGARPASSNRQR